LATRQVITSHLPQGDILFNNNAVALPAPVLENLMSYSLSQDLHKIKVGFYLYRWDPNGKGRSLP